MLRSASRILGYRLNAEDGEVGRCVDFLLDAPSWTVRYVLVDAGARLAARGTEQGRVLISPLRIRKSDWTSRRWVLDGTRQQLETSPANEPALQSLKQLIGFGLDDAEGNAGHIEDLILDDDDWQCRYLVVNGEIQLSRRSTLVPTDWLAKVHVHEHRIEAPVPRARIYEQPEYRPEAPAYYQQAGVAEEGVPSRGSSRPPSWRFSAPLGWATALQWGTRAIEAALSASARERHRRI